MPKGYVVITEDVKDPAGMAEYAKLAGKAMAGATILAFDQNAEQIEGEWHGTQTVLLEFESPDAAREWYQLGRLPGSGQAASGRCRLQRRHSLWLGLGARCDRGEPLQHHRNLGGRQRCGRGSNQLRHL